MHHKQVQFEEKELDPKKIELKSIFSEQKALHYFATNSGVSRYSIRILSEAARLGSVDRFVFASSGAPVGECEPPDKRQIV